ncbi:hypothetical protein [Dactylosporangium sp. NPDC006015]|uniref:hypothetical protein n=1 Tax=Dactylosporangium sp. NPDC006015 TaxID=3154576 RepID=UPI0033AEB358
MTMRTLPRHRLAGLAVLVTAGLAWLTACDDAVHHAPSTKMLIGVSNAGGTPSLEVRFCSGQRTQFIVLHDDTTPTALPTAARTQGDFSDDLWHITNQSDNRSSYTVQFGTVPAGWRDDRSGPIALSPDTEYSLRAHGGPMPSVRVTFTGSEVTALTDGQILTVGEDNVSETVMSSADFEAEAKRRC